MTWVTGLLLAGLFIAAPVTADAQTGTGLTTSDPGSIPQVPAGYRGVR